MLIKGFQATSLVDYPGCIASIIFTPLCNFRCPFCYNKSLVLNSPELIELDEEKIVEKLLKRKSLIDGVVISGGEPTLQKDLPEFLARIKELGFKVKLDTNGTNPDMVQMLIKNKLVDFIAMDIKGPLNKYEQVTYAKADVNAIKKSVKIIMDSKIGNVDYEFRTTVVPGLLTQNDFLEIGKWLNGAKKYCLQQFKPVHGMMNPEFENKQPCSVSELHEIKKALMPFFENVELRADQETQ